MSNKQKGLFQKLQETGNISQIEALKTVQQEDKTAPFSQSKKEDSSSFSGKTGRDKEGNTAEKNPSLPLGLELRAERKSARLQLRLPPSHLEQVKESAQKEGLSVNEWILQAMKEKLNQE